MEYIEFTTFLAPIAVAAITLLGKFLHSLLTRDSEKMKIRASSVALIDKILNEREWEKQENRIIVEKAFEHLYSKPLSFNEIKVLIYSECPNTAFRTYIKYRPVLELTEKKSKFRFKKGKRPYWIWIFSKRKFKLPKAFLKGLLGYTILAYPASLILIRLKEYDISMLVKKDIVLLGFFDILVWLMAAMFLIKGLKYQNSEKEVTRDLGDKFELDR